MAKEAAVTTEVYANQVKLFGKWNCDEVNVEDISLRVNLHFDIQIINYLKNLIF
jgi:hypothetical protein